MKQEWKFLQKWMIIMTLAAMTGLMPTGMIRAEEALNSSEKEALEEEKSEKGKTLDKTYKLEKIVVTATKTERALETLPVSVSVISEQDIEQSAVYRVDDLLRELPGVYVRSYQGILSSSTTNDVSMRGLTGEDRILVLRDGIPINDPYGGAVEWNEVDIDDIERIEVVRGPGSALYGSNAMGGVINMVTKPPEQEMKTSIKAGYGEMNTRRTSFRNSAGWGKFGYVLSGGFLNSDGYCSNKKRKSYNGDKEIDRGHFDGKIRYDIDDTSYLNLLFAHYEQTATGSYKIPDYEVNDESNRYGLNYQKQGTGWNLAVNLYMDEFDSDYTSPYYDSSTGTYNAIKYLSANDQEIYGLSLQGSINILDHHTLTLGGDCKRGEIDRHDDYKTEVRDISVRGKQEYTALFAQDEMSFGERWTVILGARYDWWNSFDGYGYDDDADPKESDYPEKSDGSFNPKLGINFRPFEGTTLRGAVGTAFRAPGLSDLYRTYVGPTATYRANPDLDPEKLLSYEIGMDQIVGDRLLIQLTLYQTDAEDLVQNIYTETIDDMKYYDKRNVSEARIRGLEIAADFTVNRELSLFANATFNETEIQEYEEKPELKGNYLANSPRTNYVFGATYDNPQIITAKLTGRYVGTRYDDDANETELDSYFTTDLKLSRWIGEHMEVALIAENINNVHFEETSSSESPGRMVMGTLKVTF